MQEIKSKIEAIVNDYNLKFAPLGIKIDLSKKYFEEDVKERSTYHPDSGVRFLNHIGSFFDRLKERNYKNERNKYHCIVLTVSPLEKSIIPYDHCKSYAFVIRKTERPHTGTKPKSTDYDVNKVSNKIEKKLNKLLKKSQKKSITSICKDTIFDAIRYGCSPKYSYKNKILGKDRYYWEIFNIILFSILAIAIIVTLYVIDLIN